LASRSFGPAKPQALLLAVLRWPFFFLPGDWSFVVQGLGTALVIYAFWFEPHHPRLVRQKLHSSNLRFGRPLRLLHMGDLHIERFTHREERIIQWVEALRADLIVFTGDVLSYSYVEDSEAMGAARRFLGALTAPLGTYAVSGSPPIDGPEVIARLQEGSPIEWWPLSLVKTGLTFSSRAIRMGVRSGCHSGAPCSPLLFMESGSRPDAIGWAP